MKQLIRAELAKLASLRVLWLAALAGVAITVIGTALAITGAGKQGSPPLSGDILDVLLRGPSGVLWFLAVTLGVLLSAGEWTHHTVRSTFLVTPRRRRVVAGKLIAGAVVGAGIALLMEIVGLALAIPWLATEGVSIPLGSIDTWGILAAVVAVSGLWCMFGVSVGSLIRNQTAALVIVLIWQLVVEGFLPVVLEQPELAQWLPGSAAQSVLQAGQDIQAMLLQPWAGGLVFVGYVALLGIAGALATTRAEIR